MSGKDSLGLVYASAKVKTAESSPNRVGVSSEEEQDYLDNSHSTSLNIHKYHQLLQLTFNLLE